MQTVRLVLSRFILMVIGLCMPIFILEIGVRLMAVAPPPIPNPTIWDFHAELGWWHIPDSGGTFYSSFNEYQTEVYINGLGLREDNDLNDYEITGDRFKVLILADSFGEALQVPLEDTFYKQLQHQLGDNGLKTQTINAGVGNWGTDQEATFYRLEGYKYNPDLVLLFFFVRNDVINNYGPLEIARNGGGIQKSFYQLDDQGGLSYPEPFNPDQAYPDEASKPPPLPPAPWLKTADWLWLNSHLYRWLAPYLRDIPSILMALGPSGILGGEGQIRATHPAVPLPFYVYQTPSDLAWKEAWQLTEAIISDLRDAVEENGQQFGVVIIPAREQVYPEEWTQTVNLNEDLQEIDWDLTRPNQQLGEILTGQNILYLDLLPIFREAAAHPNTAPLYFQHDGHWTTAGHSLAAQATFQFLKEESLLNQRGGN